jgi:transcriptional regulator with XRE-family HTH domain
MVSHPHRLALVSRKALEKLGADLRAARLRRRMSATVVAERARTSRYTLGRIEKGDPHVSMGIYVSVLNVYGFAEGIEKLADLAADEVGQNLENARLPQTSRGR